MAEIDEASINTTLEKAMINQEKDGWTHSGGERNIGTCERAG